MANTSHYRIILTHASGVGYDEDGPQIDYICDDPEYIDEVPVDEGRPGSTLLVKTANGFDAYLLSVSRTWDPA